VSFARARSAGTLFSVVLKIQKKFSLILLVYCRHIRHENMESWLKIEPMRIPRPKTVGNSKIGSRVCSAPEEPPKDYESDLFNGDDIDHVSRGPNNKVLTSRIIMPNKVQRDFREKP
jgi:hypothetical protein